MGIASFLVMSAKSRQQWPTAGKMTIITFIRVQQAQAGHSGGGRWHRINRIKLTAQQSCNNSSNQSIPFPLPQIIPAAFNLNEFSKKTLRPTPDSDKYTYFYLKGDPPSRFKQIHTITTRLKICSHVRKRMVRISKCTV